jgi:hypothetical protein
MRASEFCGLTYPSVADQVWSLEELVEQTSKQDAKADECENIYGHQSERNRGSD